MVEEAIELHSQRRSWPTAVWLPVAIFAVLSLWAAATSKGFLEADACTHYLSASFGFKQPLRFVSVWDRPLFMILYTPAAAWGGVIGARFVSLILALVCAWCAWRTAQKLKIPLPELAVIFTLGMPLVFLHSFAELTELPFAAVAGLALLAFLHRKWGAMSLLLALAPLGRPEGFGYLLLGAAALVLYRQWRWLLVLPAGLVAWSLVGWLMTRPEPYGYGVLDFLLWLPRAWPYSAESMYEAGPLLLWKKQSTGAYASSFLLRLPMLVGPLLFPFVLVGTWVYLRDWRRKICDEGGRDALVTMLLPWCVLAGHSFLWWRGLMASNGELRYLLINAPQWAVIGAMGFAWAWPRLGLPVRKLRPALLAGVLAAVPACANLYFRVVPLPLYEDDLLSIQVANWYRENDELRQKYPRLTASYIAVYLYLEYSPTDWDRTVMWGKKMVKQRPGDVVVIWDEINGTKNADASMCVTREELEKNGWRQIETFRHGQRVWYAFVAGE